MMNLNLLHLTPEDSSSQDSPEFFSMERNEDTVELIPWEGMIPDSVFEEIAEQEFLNLQTEG